MNAKNTLLLVSVAIAAFLAGFRPGYAGGVPVVFSLGEGKIIKVADFPNTPDFVAFAPKDTDAGDRYKQAKIYIPVYMDTGYRYKQVKIFYIPVWNYGGEWCGYIGESGSYVDLSKRELDLLAGHHGIQLPDTPTLPSWDSYGGKLVLLAAVVVLVLLYRRR